VDIIGVPSDGASLADVVIAPNPSSFVDSSFVVIVRRGQDIVFAFAFAFLVVVPAGNLPFTGFFGHVTSESKSSTNNARLTQ
jgi:hypothetical protein